MRKDEIISLDEVKRLLRRGAEAQVVNRGGWSVFVTHDGRPRYIIRTDDGGSHPVPFRNLSSLLDEQQTRRRGIPRWFRQ